MGLAFTYTTLKSALQAHTEDFGSEFEAALDTIIPLAETQLLKDLDLELFDVTSTGTFTATNPVVTKPDDLVALRTFHYTDANGNFTLLEPKTWEFVKDYWPNASTTVATPKYYAELSETEWYLAGTPSLNSAYTVRFIKRPDGLSPTTDTTWLSTRVPDVLLYACLVNSEEFLKADNRVPLWARKYATLLTTAKMELRRTDRNDYAPMVNTPDAQAES